MPYRILVVIWVVLAVILVAAIARGESPPVAVFDDAPVAVIVEDDPYPAARTESLRDGVPLVVYVAAQPKRLRGVREIAVATFPGVNGPGIVVGRVSGGEMFRVDLAAGASDKAILDAARPAVVERPTAQYGVRMGDAAHSPTPFAGSHAHRCGWCGLSWHHGSEWNGNRSAHTCPNCGTATYEKAVVRR